MKTFAIRLMAIVMAVILFVGAIYTCGIALHMSILSNDVAEAELRASSGDPHMRREANAIYEDVSEARQELYYGGGYKSWFSTLPKFLQILGVLVSLVIIGFGLLVLYSLYCGYKEEQEKKRRAKARQEQLRYERERSYMEEQRRRSIQYRS